MQDALSRMWRRVLLVVGRGRVTTLDDSGNVQKLQVALGADETVDGLPRLAEYGFASAPPVGSDVVALFVAGERSNGVVIACGNQTYRMRGLASGEVAIHDNRGQSVYLSAAGIVVNGGALPVHVHNTPRVTIDADDVAINGTRFIVNSETIFNGPVSQVGGGAVSFSAPIHAPNFVAPTLTLLDHRHGGVRGGDNDSGTAKPLT